MSRCPICNLHINVIPTPTDEAHVHHRCLSDLVKSVNHLSGEVANLKNRVSNLEI